MDLMRTMSSFDLTGDGGVSGVGMLVGMEVGDDLGLVTSA